MYQYDKWQKTFFPYLLQDTYVVDIAEAILTNIHNICFLEY